MISTQCPSCRATLKARDEQAGKKLTCPKCKAAFVVGGAETSAIQTTQPAAEIVTTASLPTDAAANPDIATLPSYPKLRRELAFIQLRQRVRALCGKVLGTSVLERVVCALIVAVIPFVLSFGISLAVQQTPLYAALQGLGSFAIAAGFVSALVTVGNDETLEARRLHLVNGLPAARAEWQLQREQRRGQRQPAPEIEYGDGAEQEHVPTTRRCPYCAEIVQAEARKCKHCGEIIDTALARSRHRPDRPAVQVYVQESRRSAGVAAVLELVFGIFLGTWGIGHIYAGNVGLGILILLGWWAFVIACVAFALCTAFLSIFVLVGCWFIMLVVSPILAASSV